MIGAQFGGGLGGGSSEGLACDGIPAGTTHKPGTYFGGGSPCDFKNPTLGESLILLPPCTTPISVWPPGIVDHNKPSYDGYGAPVSDSNVREIKKLKRVCVVYREDSNALECNKPKPAYGYGPPPPAPKGMRPMTSIHKL